MVGRPPASPIPSPTTHPRFSCPYAPRPYPPLFSPCAGALAEGGRRRSEVPDVCALPFRHDQRPAPDHEQSLQTEEGQHSGTSPPGPPFHLALRTAFARILYLKPPSREINGPKNRTFPRQSPPKYAQNHDRIHIRAWGNRGHAAGRERMRHLRHGRLLLVAARRPTHPQERSRRPQAPFSHPPSATHFPPYSPISQKRFHEYRGRCAFND